MDANSTTVAFLRSFWRSNFLSWPGIILFVAIGCLVAWAFGRIDLQRLSIIMLVTGSVWNLCIAVIFPITELLAWLGLYKSDAERQKGSSGVKPNPDLGYISGSALYGMAAIVPSLLLQIPAFILIYNFAGHPMTLIQYAAIWTVGLSIFFGLVCVKIARVSAEAKNAGETDS